MQDIESGYECWGSHIYYDLKFVNLSISEVELNVKIMKNMFNKQCYENKTFSFILPIQFTEWFCLTKQATSLERNIINLTTSTIQYTKQKIYIYIL